jgi:hypothetical protein
MNQLKSYFSTFLNHKLFLVLTVLTCLYTLGTKSDRYFGWSNTKNTIPQHTLTIQTDGAGYYAYLPQWFIYKNYPKFGFLDEISKKHNTNLFISGVAMDYKSNEAIDKYFIGTAICISPFFLINHGINLLIYDEGDGYSKSYQFTVSIAALFYWLLGIIGLIKLLKLYSMPNFSIAFIVAIVSLGTSVNFYASYFPSFSHIYSFCAITWFLFFAKNWAITKKPIFIISMSFLLGMIFIIRPTNSFIVLIIPFLFSNWKDFISTIQSVLQNNRIKLLLGILIFFLFIFFQLYSNYNQIGKWTLNTYPTEHFDFLLDPKWFEVLFGYRKGYFVYAPVMFLLIPAILFYVRKNIYFIIGWSLVFLLLTYITSSWWCWWYGGGLGMRPFVDFTSFLVLPVAIFFNHISNWIKLIVLTFSLLMISFYQTFQIQINKNILHYDIMTKDSFWRIFRKTDDRYSWMLHFSEQKINPNRIEKSEKFNLNPIDLTWSTKKYNQVGLLTIESFDPVLNYYPNEKWSKNKVGIRFKGEMNLCNQESNPSFKITIYQKNRRPFISDQLIGNRIDKLHTMQSFSKDFYKNINYKEIDSIKILLTKGFPITKIKNINCTFFALKSK